MERIDKDIA